MEQCIALEVLKTSIFVLYFIRFSLFFEEEKLLRCS